MHTYVTLTADEHERLEFVIDVISEGWPQVQTTFDGSQPGLEVFQLRLGSSEDLSMGLSMFER